jgi:hypothetical protein
MNRPIGAAGVAPVALFFGVVEESCVDRRKEF